MSRYNHHFANQFGSCRLLKVGRDPHRNRDVRIYALPGEFDAVGISDGTDSWVAPINTGFLEDVRKALAELQRGGSPAVLGTGAKPVGRRKISLPSDTGRTAESEQAVHRRLINTALDQQQTLRTRRVINLQA